ncbi:hypothetical protein BJ741DRAFT_270662 [Chytriomyces cf. hyalinus JEL632]|nr:hypothetical protein BJ741DRAFT_270662 [Chytriomyces cf. hyalinus JEL632]
MRLTLPQPQRTRINIFLTVAFISLVLLLVYAYAAYANGILKAQQHPSKLHPESDSDVRPYVHFNRAPLSNKHGSWVNLTSSKEIAIAHGDCFIETQHGCCLPQHVTQAAQKRFVYTLPDGANAEPRTVADIFTLLNSKRLSIIGDSISEQIFEALLIQLAQKKIQAVQEASFNPIPGTSLGRKPFPSLKRFYLPQFNATLQYVKSYRFAPSAEFDRFAAGSGAKLVLSSQQLSFVLDVSDVVVANYGMHYIRLKEKTAFRPAMTALVEAFAAERLKPNGLNKKFILRDMLPNFSAQLPNPSAPSLCSKRKVRLYKGHNRFLKEMADKFSMPFWEEGQLYRDRADAKLGLRKDGKRDCVHFCHNVFIYEPVINGLYSVLFGLMDGQRKE